MKVLKVLVYGDVDLNIMDGSAVWLTSMAGMLATSPDVQVDILLKARVKNTLLTDEMAMYPNVNMIQPYTDLGKQTFKNGNRMQVDEAVAIMKNLDEAHTYHVIIIRGFQLVKAVMDEPRLAVKTIPYITDFHHTLMSSSRSERRELGEIYRTFPHIFLQTEAMKKAFERLVNVSGKKIAILSPMIPNIVEKPRFKNHHNRLVYTGKFAKDWYTEEIITAASKLRTDISVQIAGDKFQGELLAKQNQVKELLQKTSNIDWKGAMSRSQSQQLIKEGDVGISWRSAEVDNDLSVELSTKLLEYGRLGKPILLRRTKMHEALLGRHYPLFVTTEAEFIEKASHVLENNELYERAATVAFEASQHFTMEASYHRLKELLWQYQNEKMRVVFAGHDLKFIRMAIAHCEANPQLEVKIDQWKGHEKHDELKSQELLNWADVIFCEWGLGNAVWYSKHKKAHQKLIVRMHLQERETVHPANFKLENIDKIVAISPYIFEEFHRVCNMPREKMTMIYNMIDTEAYRLPKKAGNRYHLGVCGVLPSRKRLDLSLDVLEKLWLKDKRYKLFVKSRMPEDIPWLMKRDEERVYYNQVFARIEAAPWKEAVIFDTHGNDMAEWMQKIGFMLSTSDFESFHLAPMEGMASASVPCVLRWPGAETIYPVENIFEQVTDIANFIETYIDTREKREQLQAYPRNRFDKTIICNSLEKLITEAFL
ncbi:glycosyltransferase [Listeria booriae]|uniref:glycosyltransferase n=1 Tax=Listeria booriae TaxID=1552123 RepID=UPI001624B01B|nr:glycosyltransferase [Listeria booriae]MBC2390711.1 glycosyltransferase family 4 protein [Listeria booriae]